MFCFLACGDTPASGNEQPANGGNTTTPTEQTTPAGTEEPDSAVAQHNSAFGDAPYDVDLGNGFNVHNFLGENTSFDTNAYVDLGDGFRVPRNTSFDKNAKEKMDYYLGDKALPYIKNRVQRWYQGMNAESKAYYQNFYDAIMAIQFEKGTWDPARGLDAMNNAIYEAACPYVNDCLENLDNNDKRYAYQICWDVHWGEAYKDAVGRYRDYQDTMDVYDSALYNDDYTRSDGVKNFAMQMAEDNQVFIDAGVNLPQEYASNNFDGTTQLYGNLLSEVADLKGVELAAMIEMHNICGLATGGLDATHEHTADQHWVQHSNCENTFKNKIDNEIDYVISQINRRNRTTAN